MFSEYKDEQKIAYKTLLNAINNNKISHAYLFETNKYINSFDFVKKFATEILKNNCYEKIDVETLVETNNYPDLKIIETNNLQYKKEEIKNLQKEFKTKPIYGKYKIYIIKECEKLTENISNTILKFLEEPEEGIIAILMVENEYQLLSTITSRCQIISLKNIIKDKNNIITFYEKNNYRMQNDEDIKEEIDKIMKFIIVIEKYKKSAIIYEKKFLDELLNSKEQVLKVINILKLFYVETLNLKFQIELSYLNDYKNFVEKISTINSEKKLIYKIQTLMNLEKQIYYNVNINLFIDKLLLELGEDVDG
jgi:DNA polymerase-3 subunit delta'